MPTKTELEQAEQELARWQTIVDYLRARQPSRNGTQRRRPSGSLTAGQAAEEALRQAGGPMRTPDLLKAVQAAGARMKDTDGLYKTLSRSTKFRKAGRGLWELA